VSQRLRELKLWERARLPLRLPLTEGSDRDAVQACRIVLDMMTRHRDAVYVLDRLAALEDATARRGAA
jgi:hypothetical protein